jgi:hypothetical protein
MPSVSIAPSHLSNESKALYRAVLAGWTLGSAQLSLLLAACEEKDATATASAVIRAEGQTYTTGSGQVKARPEVAIASKANEHAQRFLKLLDLDSENPPPEDFKQELMRIKVVGLNQRQLDEMEAQKLEAAAQSDEGVTAKKIAQIRKDRKASAKVKRPVEV